MARVSIAVQKPQRQKMASKRYSTAEISEQLASACLRLDRRTKAIERKEQRSWARARNRSV